MTNIGVLALQGDVREHVRALTTLGATARLVRRATDLEGIDGIVLPGGESTTIDKLARAFGLRDPLRDALRDGSLAAYGSCAGMILLADRIEDPASGQEPFGGIDMTVRRNAFGRQVDSFEEDLAVGGVDGPVRAVFIRAPAVVDAGEGVDVLARTSSGEVVAVRQARLLATSFHPEVLDDDVRVHRAFLDLVG